MRQFEYINLQHKKKKKKNSCWGQKTKKIRFFFFLGFLFPGLFVRVFIVFFQLLFLVVVLSSLLLFSPHFVPRICVCELGRPEKLWRVIRMPNLNQLVPCRVRLFFQPHRHQSTGFKKQQHPTGLEVSKALLPSIHPFIQPAGTTTTTRAGTLFTMLDIVL